jgi:hypothetical protein
MKYEIELTYVDMHTRLGAQESELAQKADRGRNRATERRDFFEVTVKKIKSKN